MTDSAYKQAYDKARGLLPQPVRGMHPDAVKQHYGLLHAAAHAYAEAGVAEKNPDKAQRVLKLSGQVLQRYDAFALRVAHLPPEVAKAQNNAFFNELYSQAMAQPANREALDLLRQNMQGDTLLGMVYDRKKAKLEDSTLSGIRWGGIAGGIAGALAGGVFGVDGIWGIAIRGAMALGFAYGGNMIQDWVTKKDQSLHAAPPATPGRKPGPRGTTVGMAEPGQEVDMETLRQQALNVKLQGQPGRPNAPLAPRKPGGPSTGPAPIV